MRVVHEQSPYSYFDPQDPFFIISRFMAAACCIIMANSQKVCDEKVLIFISVTIFPPGFGYSHTLSVMPVECFKMLLS